ncbi:MAG: hypothetical protein MUF64_11130 [Polyangiaceae bacterium]|jgi:hypothetical protein|nr:hypothetical protein [Polyangiaceae bacterium]
MTSSLPVLLGAQQTEGTLTYRPALAGDWRLRLDDADLPRIRDLDLAERLDFERPRKIRDLIRRYRESGDLGEIHVRPTVGRTSMPRGGERETLTDEYWLTEEQALFLVAKSETPVATALLREMIAVFVAVRRGLLALPSPRPAEGAELEQLHARVAQLEARTPRAVSLSPEALADRAWALITRRGWSRVTPAQLARYGKGPFRSCKVGLAALLTLANRGALVADKARKGAAFRRVLPPG